MAKPAGAKIPYGELQRIVGDANVCPANTADAVDGIDAHVIVDIDSAKELAEALQLFNVAKISVVARGGGTKINWGNPPSHLGAIISTRRMNRIIEHAHGDMTATVEAGCTIAALNQRLAQHGQRLALDPLWPARATVGGIIATNDSGALRLGFGTLRDHLIGITIVLADGTISRSGGKVVKNVAGYDLQKLIIGSFGTLGIITQATFRLYPLAHASRTLSFTGDVPLESALAALRPFMPLCSAVQFEMGDQSSLKIRVLVEGLSEAIEAKTRPIMEAARSCGLTEASESTHVWVAREKLFDDNGQCVCKFTALPTKLPGLVDQIKQLTLRSKCKWQIVGQAGGSGLLSISSNRLLDMLPALRSAAKDAAGFVTVLRSPTELKKQMDVWPDVGNALPLMRRVKDQFDPNNILSPGRFVGGI